MQSGHELVIRNGTVVTPAGPRELDLAVSGERIAALGAGLRGSAELDASGLLVLPGAVDGHVHLGLELPGATSVDDMASGTIAAARGGVTTVIDFATPADGESLAQALAARRAQADGVVAIDYGLHVCVTKWRPEVLTEIQALPAQGVSSIKMFMNYLDRGWMADDRALYAVLRQTAETGMRLLVHAENDHLIGLLQAELEESEQWRQLGAQAHLRTRPEVSEWEAVQRVLTWAEVSGGRLFVVHISTPEAAALVKEARLRGVDVIGETCPQYLLLDDELLRGEAGHLYATCPPLRALAARDRLRGLSAAGGIQVIGSDTCAWSRADKEGWGGDYRRLLFGLHGVDVLLPLTYELGVHQGLWGLERWVELVSAEPARAHGLWPRKGNLMPGADADVVLFDPKRVVTLGPDTLYTASEASPYQGMRCHGWPVTTLSRGRVIVRDGDYIGQAGQGQWLPRAV